MAWANLQPYALNCQNPSWTTKDRVLKEVTNKLDVSPVAFKPLWAGPRVGSGSASREILGFNNRPTTAKACLGSEGAVRMSGSVS